MTLQIRASDGTFHHSLTIQHRLKLLSLACCYRGAASSRSQSCASVSEIHDALLMHQMPCTVEYHLDFYQAWAEMYLIASLSMDVSTVSVEDFSALYLAN